MLKNQITIKNKLSLKSKSNNEHKFDLNITIQSNHVVNEQTLDQLDKNIKHLILTQLYEYQIDEDNKRK